MIFIYPILNERVVFHLVYYCRFVSLPLLSLASLSLFHSSGPLRRGFPRQRFPMRSPPPRLVHTPRGTCTYGFDVSLLLIPRSSHSIYTLYSNRGPVV